MSEDPASPAGGRLANVTAAVLVGGVSEAFGRDKAGVELADVPLATRAARLLSDLFEEVLLVGGEPPGDAPGRRISDPDGPECPLRGLVGALEAAGEERVLVLAVHHPLVTPDLLLALTAWPEAQIVAPRVEGRPQPLCAIYLRDEVLPHARKRLASDSPSLHGLVSDLECGWLEGADLTALDPDGRALLRVGGADDLDRASKQLGR